MVLALGQDADEPESDFTPYLKVDDMLTTIDSVKLGDAPWESFECTATNSGPDSPPWTKQTYEVWFRDVGRMADNMVANPDFKDEFDCIPYREFDDQGEQRFCDFFSGLWSWEQAVRFFH